VVDREQFSTENIHFWKTPETELLDGEYGDIDSNIQSQQMLAFSLSVLTVGKELEIVLGLIDRVVQIDKKINEIMNVMADLDGCGLAIPCRIQQLTISLLALARAVYAHGLVRPCMMEEPVLEIHRGRHLLQEMWVEHYVANDTLLEGGPAGVGQNMVGRGFHAATSCQHETHAEGKMIVTGANGSGKSAYGKQVSHVDLMSRLTSGRLDSVYGSNRLLCTGSKRQNRNRR
jgi:DNA mismatch repair protein MSH5